MKKPVLNTAAAVLFAMTLSIACTVQTARADETTSPAGTPVAVVPETVYEFPETVDGDYVVHDFVVRNEGDAVLNVLRVKTT